MTFKLRGMKLDDAEIMEILNSEAFKTTRGKFAPSYTKITGEIAILNTYIKSRKRECHRLKSSNLEADIARVLYLKSKVGNIWVLYFHSN